MSATFLRAAALLIIAGAVILTGYGIYYFFKGVFEAAEVPLIIRAAVVAGALGFVFLILVVIWDRIRQMKGERFTERD